MHRVATSETYRAPLTAVREMPVRDLIVALVQLDYVDDVRAELEPKEEGPTDG